MKAPHPGTCATCHTPITPGTPIKPALDIAYDEADDWRDAAACTNYDPELWYSQDKSPTHRRNTAEAIKICTTECPVRAQCLTAALEHEHGTTRHGVWAGLLPHERDAHVKKLRRRKR